MTTIRLLDLYGITDIHTNDDEFANRIINQIIERKQEFEINKAKRLIFNK